jgi:DNA-binding NarL/FixJ family response regulator
MKVVVVEDDRLQSDHLKSTILRYFPTVSIQQVANESEFRARFAEFKVDPPAAMIIDVMLRWTDPSPDLSMAPQDVLAQGHHRAGIRCQQLLQSDTATRNIAVILYTAMDPITLQDQLKQIPANVMILAKGADESRLVMLLRGILQSQNVFKARSSVFLGHGHDEESKQTVARFIERLGLDVLVLHEQPNVGNTIIEKLEQQEAVFAVVLLTPDDVGFTNQAKDKLQPRARQNVIFELGYFVGRLGRRNVCALYKDTVEIPSDFHGVVYIPLDHASAWRGQLARELRASGMEIDLSRIL